MCRVIPLLCHYVSMPELDSETADIGFTSAIDLAAGLRDGDFTSAELTATLLHRVRQVDDCENGLQSVLAIAADAMDQAADRDTNTGNGRLQGLPVLIKDNIEAVGLPATAGSLALAGRTVTRDAEIVTRLRNAGAVIMGSTNLSEWANIRSSQSTSGWSAIGGLTANPWIFQHSAGGSSSGSGAAVAAGLIPFAVGTETDGSIVCPASLNGVVGIKPTVGTTSRTGVIPISASQDSPGPMARNVADASLLLDVLAGTDTLRQNVVDDSPLRIGIMRQWVTSDLKSQQVFEDSLAILASAGIELIEVRGADMTEQDNEDEGAVLFHELLDDLGQYLAARPGDGVKSLADVIEFNKTHSDSEMMHFQQELFDIAVGTGGRNEVYRQARTRNLEWALHKVLNPAIADVDVLIGVPYGPAWVSTLGEGDDYADASWMTHAPAIAGWPIGCLPMGLVRGLPVGMGVVARANDENALVRAMTRIERVLDLGTLRPTFTQ